MDLTPTELREKYPNYEFSDDHKYVNIKGKNLKLAIPSNISKDMHDNVGRLLSYCEKSYEEEGVIMFEFYGLVISTNFETICMNGGGDINDTLSTYLDKYGMVLEFTKIAASRYSNYKVCIDYDFSIVFRYEELNVKLPDLSHHVHDTILYTTIFLEKNCETSYFDEDNMMMKYYFKSYSHVKMRLDITYYINVDLKGYYIENFKDKSVKTITADEIFDYIKSHSSHLFNDTNKQVICE